MASSVLVGFPNEADFESGNRGFGESVRSSTSSRPNDENQDHIQEHGESGNSLRVIPLSSEEMAAASEICKPPEPAVLYDTPYHYHVCIIASEADRDIESDVRSELKELGFDVHPGHESNPEDYSRAEDSISRSQKVMFIVTTNFLRESRFAQEIMLAAEKAESISSDIIIIARKDDVDDRMLRNAGLLKKPAYRMYRLDDKNIVYLQSLVAGNPVQNLKIHKNFGSALACSYYYGYLRIILPELKRRLCDSGFMDGIQRNDDFRENLNDRNMSHKFFIIIPESHKGPPSFNSLDKSITDIGKVPFKVGRGGHPVKDYSSYVHQIKIIDQGHSKNYLFLGEIPAILINLYDMGEDGKPITDRTRHLELCQFFSYLKFLLDDDTTCQGTYSFIFHRDLKHQNPQQPIGDVIRSKILEELNVEIMDSYNEASDVSPNADNGAVGGVNRSDSTLNMETLTIHESSLKAKFLCNPLKYYDLCLQEKYIGKALVINNIDFTVKSGLGRRKGAEKDEEQIVKLLKELKFDVDCKRDQTGDQMWNLAAHYSRNGTHDNPKAFVCVLMTHGVSGQLYGIDKKEVSIVQFMEVIGQCGELKRCPKMFFIEACQNIDSSNGAAAGAHGSTASRKCLTPSVADTLASFSTLPGKTAYRDTKAGALYIYHLCKVIREKRKGMELEHMLKLVCDDVKRDYEKRHPENASSIAPDQLPFFVTTLDKRVALTM